MNSVKGVLLRVNVYEKKDNQGKGLSIDLLTNYEDVKDLSSGKVISMFAGKAYTGNYDYSNFKRFEEVDIEYNQPIGSQYPQLIDIKKISK